MESTRAEERENLVFFGQISAAISHDLKNVLAIINEDAGLLHDFSLMAAQGMELDPERLGRVAGKIQNQVRRGDTIIKNMNRFAHSVDKAECEVNYSELAALVISLLTRMASRKCVTVTLAESGPVMGKGDPFVIQMLIARCLENCMDCAGKDEGLSVAAAGSDGTGSVEIAGLVEEIPAEVLDGLKDIAENAGASLKYTPQEKVLSIIF
ncbi:sensor histidine kinase [Maridesulfovibrio sp.]|uniref:sensor histidine kinase n=1 Tax=Maridesulfovibrio sp. TaxID=2795000 RepID=UPI002A18B707|nr:sensor histidine kinase [Maridesulfovibrio sp.]